ncbi:MAG TPA: Hsp33 family molecular chaperone HslO [Woeseiaceae bacterium]
MSADGVIPFGFESLPVRGALIHLTRAWRRMLRDHDYDALVTETLGHAAAATGLIAQSLKFDGAVTLQLLGKGALQMLVMQCTDNMHLRGMATTKPGGLAADFRELTAGAHCAVTVDAGDRPYQGIVAIEGDSLATSLEHYFARSVQVPSHVALVAGADFAGGLLLQTVPGQPIDPDDWQRLQFIARTLSERDFAGEAGVGLIGRLFAEDDVRVHPLRPVSFRCRCSSRRAGEVLKMLGEADVREAVAEQGRIEVTCEYCGRLRRFDAVDIERLFSDNVVAGPDSVH